MLPEHGVTTHPGQMLLKEFLEPGGISQAAFARHLGVPLQRINELIRGKRGVTAETAWMLAQALGTSPELWMNLQSMYDLTLARENAKRRRIARIRYRKAG